MPLFWRIFLLNALVLITAIALLLGPEDERTTSSARVLSAQEAERRRIAQELHDEVGQTSRPFRSNSSGWPVRPRPTWAPKYA